MYRLNVKRNIYGVFKSNELLAATRDSSEFEYSVGDKSMRNDMMYIFQQK